MNGFRVNEKGHLMVGSHDTVELADRYGTPLWVYDEAMIRQNCRHYMTSFQHDYGDNFNVIFAGKAFLCKAMCRLIEQEGLCVDVVSGGELYTALKADFPAERIWFHGNNKTRPEIEFALKSGIGRIVVDSFNELALIERVAEDLHTVADVQLRITPGIKPSTHSYISTGQLDSKFGFSLSNGVALDAVRRASTSNRIALKGLHCHIGSQIFELESFAVAARMMVEFIHDLYDNYGIEINELNMGGGLGIRYLPQDNPPPIAEYVRRLTSAVKEAWGTERPLPRLMVEPGRSLVGETGITLYRVGTIKEIPGIRTYIAVDGGMNDNPRVALYQAKYHAALANKMSLAQDEKVSISGRCCETGDMLVWDAMLPTVDEADLVVLFSTGAYHHSMASNYNRLPRPAVLFVLGDEVNVVVERETYDDLVAHDRVPAHLQSKTPATLPV